MSAVSIPKEYYALVHDVKRISTLNFNVFTLRTCLTEIVLILGEGAANNGPKIDPLLLQVPLMKNWTESKAEKRDKYDLENGRGHGLIDDCITKEYRMKKLADEQAESSKKHSSRKSSVTRKRKVDCVSEVPANLKPFMDRVMNDMKEIRKELFRMPELCAQRLLEKMNKTGVRYKPGTMAEKEGKLFGQNSESSGHYDLDSEGGDSFKLSTGHLSSYKGEKDDPIDVPEQSEKKEASSLKTDEIEATRWQVQQNKQEVSQGVSDGNSEIEEKKEFDHSVDDMVRAAVQYVKAYEHSPKHKNHEIFNNGKDEGLSAARVIDAYATYISDSSIVKDRYLREQLAGDIQDANDSAIMSFPDVSAWPIVPYDMPQQEDG
nr:uncharacterized protein LOC109734371 [Aegilops tauschii subsp. strangulata]